MNSSNSIRKVQSVGSAKLQLPKSTVRAHLQMSVMRLSVKNLKSLPAGKHLLVGITAWEKKARPSAYLATTKPALTKINMCSLMKMSFVEYASLAASSLNRALRSPHASTFSIYGVSAQ